MTEKMNYYKKLFENNSDFIIIPTSKILVSEFYYIVYLAEKNGYELIEVNRNDLIFKKHGENNL